MRNWTAALLLVLLAPAPPALWAQSCRLHRDCGPGTLCDAGRCRPVDQVVAPNGTVYWVDRHHPTADDRNPGTRAHPWKTITRATGRGVLRPGDAVVVRAGIYREAIHPRTGGSGPAARVTYAAFPGDEVVVTGADPLSGPWVRSGDTWRIPWTQKLTAYGTGAFRRELVVADGAVLRPVYSRSEVAPGTFFVEGSDEAPTALYLRLRGDGDPAAHDVEAARRHPLFWPIGDDPYPDCGDASQPGWLRVIGFTFRHAANRAQWGAVCAGREGGLVEAVTVAWTNGLGIDASGTNHHFRGNRAVDNGQMGFGGRCDGCLFEYNEASRNNWKGFDPFWEAGGGKFVETRGTTFRHHLAQDNDGPGLWLDIRNEDNTIEQSHFVRNQVAGVMLELATVRTTVRNNVIFGTRWRGWSGTGLLVQAAGQNAILHNTIYGNEGTGLWLRLDPDRRAPEGHNTIFNNLIVHNAAAPRGDAREIQVEGADAAVARSNRLDGNVYGAHPARMDVSTFYFAPDRASPANFRSSDLVRWRTLTGGDAHARLADPDRPLLRDPTSPGGWRLAPGAAAVASGVALPSDVAPVGRDADGDARPPAGPTAGADQQP